MVRGTRDAMMMMMMMMMTLYHCPDRVKPSWNQDASGEPDSLSPHPSFLVAEAVSSDSDADSDSGQ